MKLMPWYVKSYWDLSVQLQSIGISRDCHVLQLQLTCTPRGHLAGYTNSYGKMYGNCDISPPATFKAPSQLAAIFYLYSDVAREAGKLAAVLSVALQFPQFWHWFPKRFIWKLFRNQSEGKKEEGKLNSFRKPQKSVASIILKSDNFHGTLSSPDYWVSQRH